MLGRAILGLVPEVGLGVGLGVVVIGHVDLCVGVRGCLLHASGYGLDLNESAARPTFAPMAEVRAGLRPGRALLGVALGGGVEVIRDELRIDLPDGSTELLCQAPLLFGRVGVYVGLQI